MKRVVLYVIIALTLTPLVSQAETFGYELVGGFSTSIVDLILGITASPSSNGTLDSVKVYLDLTDAAQNVKVAVYDSATGDLIDSSAAQSLGDADDGWNTFTLLLNGTVTAGTDYHIMCWAESGGGGANMYFNISGAGWEMLSQTYGAWPDPITGTTSYDRDVSIYAYYTVAGGSGVVNFLHSSQGSGVLHSSEGNSVRHASP